MSQNYFIKLWKLSYKINSLIKEIGYWEYCKQRAVFPTFGRISEQAPFVLIRNNQIILVILRGVRYLMNIFQPIIVT
jgi:hypothetical protein